MTSTNRNPSAQTPASAGFRPNPLHCLSASLQYLASYTKALAKEYGLPDEEVPVPVICMAPDQTPYLDFSDRVELLQGKGRSDTLEEPQTGLMLTCLEGEPLAADDGFLLIGPAVLFRCEGSRLCPVSAQDLHRARELYAGNQEGIQIGPVRVPAIRIRPAGRREA